MSPTHDMIIDNSTGANVRADINNALAALVSNSSSSSEPSTKYAYMWWADTTSGTLKIRNSANNAWIELLQLDGTLTLEDGSASTPALAFRDDLNTGIFSSASDTFNIATGGVERVEFGAATIFNDTGADVDLRIEGDTDQNLLFCNAGGNAVGIGTSTPGSKLHIFQSSASAATGNSGAGLSLESNSHQYIQYLGANNKEQGILFGDDADNDVGSIVYNHDDNKLTFATAANMRLMIDSSGRVLIGTSTNTFTGVGSSRLQVSGTGADTSGINLIRTSNDGGGAFLQFTKNRGSATQSGDTCGAISWMGHDGTDVESYLALIRVIAGATATSNSMRGDIVFETADGSSVTSERMRLDSSGNLGIGNRTSSPDELLHVHTGSGEAIIHVEAATNPRLRLRAHSGESIIQFADAASSNPGEINYVHASDLMTFRTNGTVRGGIDSSGRFLIGVTTARNAFAFTQSAGIQAEGAYNHGSISSTNNENNGNTCAFVSAKIRGASGACSADDIVGSHDFQAFDGTAFRTIGRMDAIVRSSGGISNNVISGDIRFVTRIDGQTPHEVLRLDHARRVLIGCSAIPSASTAGASIDGDPADLPVYYKSSSRQHGSNAYTHSQFFNTNGAVGGIMVNGSGTAFQTSSDYRLKENETAITDGITRMKQLKPYKFNFKADPSTVLDGFFAHEVASVVPDAVSGEKDYVATEANVKSGLAENVGDIMPQQIDHSKLVPLLVAAVKDLITKVETLEAA